MEQKSDEKYVIYLAGPITGVADYRERFTLAEAMVRRARPDAVILNPATLPDGLTLGQYMRICFSMMAGADQDGIDEAAGTVCAQCWREAYR